MLMYSGFAEIYDALMHDAPYDEWAGWLGERLSLAPDGQKIKVDLGCGTGSVARK